MRYDDDLARLERRDELHEVRVAIDPDHLVHEGERAIEPFGLAVGDGQRPEPLVARALQYLQRGVRAQRTNRVEVVRRSLRRRTEEFGSYHSVIVSPSETRDCTAVFPLPPRRPPARPAGLAPKRGARR